jgi:hypothetical protein
MNPVLVIAIPLVLIILGMILNGLNLHFDQPPSSPEKDPAKRLAADKEIYREFFSNQRERAMKRQKRIGQYAWLLMFVTVGSFIWLYVDTVKKTTLSNRIAALQTLGTEEGKQTVLSVTLLDGDNAKYHHRGSGSRERESVKLGAKRHEHGFEQWRYFIAAGHLAENCQFKLSKR